MNVAPEEVFRFGIMSADVTQRITRFTEKPKQSDSTLASMGIYVFNARFLLAAVKRGRGGSGIVSRLRKEHHPQDGGKRQGIRLRVQRLLGGRGYDLGVLGD